MRNKMLYLIVTFIVISATIVTGCGSSKSGIVEGKVNVITSFYPLYDFTKKIGGEHVNVVNLVETGVDPHDWTPTPKDMVNMTDADLFIYNGLGFEGWVDGFLGGLKSDSKLKTIEATHGINLITLDSEAEHEEEAAHVEEKHDEHGHEEEAAHVEEKHDEHGHGEFDPHVWLSPLQAKKMAENIKDALIEVDAANQADYEANYDTLIAQLDELDLNFKETVDASPRKDIVVSHEAFGYLARDYGLIQVGVMGLSTSAEPTPQAMKSISDYVKDNDVKYILFEELVSPRLAETLAKDAGIETLVFNPLEGLTDEQVANGEDYISMMERNLTSLEKALQ